MWIRTLFRFPSDWIKAEVRSNNETESKKLNEHKIQLLLLSFNSFVPSTKLCDILSRCVTYSVRQVLWYTVTLCDILYKYRLSDKLCDILSRCVTYSVCQVLWHAHCVKFCDIVSRCVTYFPSTEWVSLCYYNILLSFHVYVRRPVQSCGWQVVRDGVAGWW